LAKGVIHNPVQALLAFDAHYKKQAAGQPSSSMCIHRNVIACSKPILRIMPALPYRDGDPLDLLDLQRI